jgi:NADH-quinone oxidoreductase subunit M
VLLLTSPLLCLVALLGLSFAFSLLSKAEDIVRIRIACLLASLFALATGLLACLSFDKAAAGYQLMDGFNFVSQYNLTFALGVDGLSLVFLLLTLFIFPVLFLSA